MAFKPVKLTDITKEVTVDIVKKKSKLWGTATYKWSR